MRVESVPDDNDWPTDPLSQVAQTSNHVFAFDGSLEVQHVELAAQRQADEHRQLAPPADSPQHRRLAFRCPSRSHLAQKAETRLVNKDDLRLRRRPFY